MDAGDCILPLTIMFAGSEDPQVLAVTSAEESKRQIYIHELINTEESYVLDMAIVLEVIHCVIEC